MKWSTSLALGLLGLSSLHTHAGTVAERIIADHNAVEQFDQIPESYIQEVKKMLVNIPGESHGRGYLYGVEQVGQQDPTFAASTKYDGAPEEYTDQHLRVHRPLLFDAGYGPRWSTSAGEEEIWTSDIAITNVNNNFAYAANTLGNNIDVFLWGWCWDMRNGDPSTYIDPVHNTHWYGWQRVYDDAYNMVDHGAWGLDDDDTEELGAMVSMDDYLRAIEKYNNDNPNTVIVFTTGPADRTDERGYQAYLKNEHIRDHVTENNNRVLFDYADILSYDNEGNQRTTTWNDTAGNSHTFEVLHQDNYGEWDGGHRSAHISQQGTIRLGKAMWWMLARIAGWDGVPADEVDTPTFTPAPGSYNDSITITLSNATDGAQIYYTLDGNEPTEASTLYTAPITISSSTEIKARAFKDGIEPSSILEGHYEIIIDTIAPEISAAEAISANEIEIVFSESVQFNDLTTLENYSIDNGATIESVLVTNPTNNTVVLTTSDLTPDTTYTITINNISDENGNQIEANSQTQVIYTVVDLPASLQQHWDFETTNDITVYGATHVNEGKSGKAFSFSGAEGEYVNLGTSTHGLEETNEFTLAAWIKFENSLSGNIIIRGRYVFPYRMTTSGSYMRSVIRTNRTNYVRGTTPLSAGAWHHVALSYKDGERTMYVDGAIDLQDSITGDLYTLNNAQEIKVGEGFNGIIDEIQIYNKALTPEQVNNLYSGEIPQFTQAPEITPESGTYTNAIEVNISSATENAAIYYTLNGADPDEDSTLYQEAFTLDQDATLKAIAYSEGKEPSEIVSTEYIFDIDTVGPSIASNKVVNSTKISIEFNEAVEPTSAENTANYSITPALNIVRVQLNADQKTVELTVEEIPENIAYSMVVFGVEDLAGNPNPPSTGFDFIYIPLSTEDSLTGYWSFDESSGITVNDATPFGNHGEILGATRVTNGVSGGALEFDGDDIVNLGVSHFEIDTTNEFSLSLWFKFDETFVGHLIRRGPYVYPFRIYSNARRISTTVRTNRTNYMSSTIFPEAGVWHHCVLTYGNGQRALYINGVLDNNSALDGILNFYSEFDTNLGENYVGAIDEVKIYNKALSSEEVEVIYQQ